MNNQINKYHIRIRTDLNQDKWCINYSIARTRLTNENSGKIVSSFLILQGSKG